MCYWPVTFPLIWLDHFLAWLLVCVRGCSWVMTAEFQEHIHDVHELEALQGRKEDSRRLEGWGGWCWRTREGKVGRLLSALSSVGFLSPIHSAWKSLSSLPRVEILPFPSGQPRCPRNLLSLVQLEGPLPAANNLPEHKIWTSLMALTTSCLWCPIGRGPIWLFPGTLQCPAQSWCSCYTGLKHEQHCAFGGPWLWPHFRDGEMEAQTSGWVCPSTQSRA